MYYNMNKKLIRLTESDLHKIVNESVQKILRETEMHDEVQALGRVYKLIEEILSIVENYRDEFEYALGDNVASAVFQIKKAYDLLKQDTNRNLKYGLKRV